MNKIEFKQKVVKIQSDYHTFMARINHPCPHDHGLYQRYEFPVLDAGHIPPAWRFDFDYQTNPYLLQRMGINAVFNSGAIKIDDRYILMPRIEGWDRKSFFAIAESHSPIDGFTFHDYPILIPELDASETNHYDMRLTYHEDGWIYGVFCVEYKDPAAHAGDTSAAVAQAGIIRSKNLIDWERLPNLVTPASQQRNAVLHPEFVDHQYAFYTRPQDSFIDTGSGGGIGWGLTPRMGDPIVKETIIDPKIYHTIKESKNGQGPAPIKTPIGWLHLAHGVRNSAAGLRYVLYLFLTGLSEPWKVTHCPGGYFMAPEGSERVGDVSNVLFSNGWILDENDMVYLYYGSSDTRLHVASSPLAVLLDYVCHTPPDGTRSTSCVRQRIEMIQKNLKYNPINTD